MCNGQITNAIPCYRRESCYLTTLQLLKLLKITMIRVQWAGKDLAGMPWSSLRYWAGNCYDELRTTTSTFHAHCATLRNNVWQKYQKRIRACGLSVARWLDTLRAAHITPWHTSFIFPQEVVPVHDMEKYGAANGQRGQLHLPAALSRYTFNRALGEP